MDELERLKSERNNLNLQIEEIEKKRREDIFVGKCYKDTFREIYYKILGMGHDDAYYISIDLNDKVVGVIGRDYDDISTFTSYDDTVEITKEEFNGVLNKAVKTIMEL